MSVEFHDLRISGRGDRRLTARETQEYVPVFQNVHVRTEALGAGGAFWDIGRHVAQARVLAIAASFADLHVSFDYVFTMQSALVARGMATVPHNPAVTMRVSGGSCRPLTLPAVDVGGTLIRETSLRRSRALVGSRPVVSTPQGVPTDPLCSVAVDLARGLPVHQGVAELSMVLADQTRFDRWHQEESRAREFELKTSIHSSNLAEPSKYGRARAVQVIDVADAGVDSPYEAVLKWMLAAVMDTRGLSEIQIATQHMVRTDYGTYFIDVALPELKIALEFDGMGKLKAPGADEYARVRAEKEREDNLRAKGWRFVRLTWTDMRNTLLAYIKLAGYLNDLGVAATVPPTMYELGYRTVPLLQL